MNIKMQMNQSFFFFIVKNNFPFSQLPEGGGHSGFSISYPCKCLDFKSVKVTG